MTSIGHGRWVMGQWINGSWFNGSSMLDRSSMDLNGFGMPLMAAFEYCNWRYRSASLLNNYLLLITLCNYIYFWFFKSRFYSLRIGSVYGFNLHLLQPKSTRRKDNLWCASSEKIIPVSGHCGQTPKRRQRQREFTRNGNSGCEGKIAGSFSQNAWLIAINRHAWLPPSFFNTALPYPPYHHHPTLTPPTDGV